MPGIACKDVDIAGGAQIAGGQTKFKVRGKLAVVLGDPVTPHGPPVPPHTAPFMAEATAKFRIQGIATCREGHAANCGHQTTGRAFFRIP